MTMTGVCRLKRVILSTLCLSLTLACSCRATAALPHDGPTERNSDGLLRSVAATLRGMEPYEVLFRVETGDGVSVDGRCIVAAERYSLSMEGLEVYGAGTTRWEVHRDRREVLIDRVDTTARNLIDNPARAFELAGNGYDARLVAGEADRAVVRLRPHDAGAMSALELTVDTRSMLPLAVTYDFDGDLVRIRLLRVSRAASAPESYDPSRHAGYEVIDFR